MCLAMRAHWCNLANTTELVLPSAHLSPQPKRQINRFSRFCTTHSRKSLYFQWVPLSSKIAQSHGGSGPPFNTWFLGPIEAHNPNGISIGSVVFAQMTTECSYSLQWDASPPQNCLFQFLWTPSNTWFLGPPESSIQTVSQSVQPFFGRAH